MNRSVVWTESPRIDFQREPNRRESRPCIPGIIYIYISCMFVLYWATQVLEIIIVRTSHPPVSVTALFRLYISGPLHSLDLRPGAAKTKYRLNYMTCMGCEDNSKIRTMRNSISIYWEIPQIRPITMKTILLQQEGGIWTTMSTRRIELYNYEGTDDWLWTLENPRANMISISVCIFPPPSHVCRF